MAINRKQSIADAAEQLFAARGYEQTSTQLIAREAGVSEALIFKHFGTKDKLLESLVKNGYRRIVARDRGILPAKGEALNFVRDLLDLPARLVSEEPRFWEMQYRLIDMPVSLNEHVRFLKPVNTLLSKAFAELGYESPKDEAQLLMLLIDALWKQEVILGVGSTQPLSNLMKLKYQDMRS